MGKVTFTLDDETVRTLRKVALRTRKPQSLIVREAVAQYAAREETLADDERERLLGVVRQIKRRPATRSEADVKHELEAIRKSRRTGWSRRAR
jgi:hypothetical protein